MTPSGEVSGARSRVITRHQSRIPDSSGYAPARFMRMLTLSGATSHPTSRAPNCRPGDWSNPSTDGRLWYPLCIVQME